MSPRSRPNPEAVRNRRRTLFLCALLTAVTLASYGRIFSLGFVNIDDQPYVTENPRVLAGLGWSGVAWAFTTTKESYWHPLTWISLMLDATIGGADPRIYHATNILLHLTNTLLLFFLLQRLTGFLWRSGFVAALFAVHPLHVESVAWVVERKDVLSTLFLFLTIAAHAYYVERPTAGRRAAVAVLFALGLMAKPMLVTLPVVLLLLDYWPLGRWHPGGVSEATGNERAASNGAATRGSRNGTGQTRVLARDGTAARSKSLRSLVLEKVPLFVLAGASSLITLVAKGSGVKPLEEYPLGERVANALVSYLFYIGKMIVPRRLAALYPHPHGAIPLWEASTAALFLFAVSIAALLLARRRPWVLVGWLWYLITLVPVIGIVQAGLQARADRYTYIPLIGLFIIVAWGAPDLILLIVGSAGASGPSCLKGGAQGADPGTGSDAAGSTGAAAAAPAGPAGFDHPPPRGGPAAVLAWPLRHTQVFVAAAAIVVVIGLGALTWVQVGHWRNGVNLLTHAIEATDDNAIAHNDLSLLLAARGDVDQAVAHLREALRIAPRYADAHYNLTNDLFRLGRLDEAAELCREELDLWPGDGRTMVNLGLLAMFRKDFDGAADRFNEALRLNPDEVFAHINLAWIRSGQQRFQEAQEHYAQVVRIVGPEKARRLGAADIPGVLRGDGSDGPGVERTPSSP